jgi:hypothetical protein
MYAVISPEDLSLGRKKHTYFGYLGFPFVYFKESLLTADTEKSSSASGEQEMF